jgi:hypothetical protein
VGVVVFDAEMCGRGGGGLVTVVVVDVCWVALSLPRDNALLSGDDGLVGWVVGGGPEKARAGQGSSHLIIRTTGGGGPGIVIVLERDWARALHTVRERV